MLKRKRTIDTLNLPAWFRQGFDAVSYLRWNVFMALICLGTKISVVA